MMAAGDTLEMDIKLISVVQISPVAARLTYELSCGGRVFGTETIVVPTNDDDGGGDGGVAIAA